MFIYWFERILNKAAQEQFPGAEVTLPYWNYAEAAHRALPEPFRVPPDPALNPLYVVERGRGVNAGSASTNLSIYDHSDAFAQDNFFHTVNGGVSFGGIVATAPTHLGPGKGGRGLLENMPHGGIHNWVGGTAPNGSPGFMATLRYAPRDPIFWLHHANLDRLWKRWLDQGGGRQNPTGNNDWMNDVFTYFDEFGEPVTMTAAEILDTVGQLDYCYDDDPVIGTAAARIASGSKSAGAPAREATRVIGTGIASTGAIVVGPRSATVPIALKGALPPPPAPGRRKATIVLTIEGLLGGGVASGAVDVYVNLPPTARPTQKSPSFIAPLSLFGIQPWDMAVHGGEGSPADHSGVAKAQSFDITNTVAALRKRKGWTGKLAVTFVPTDLSGSPLPNTPVATIEQVVLRTDG